MTHSQVTCNAGLNHKSYRGERTEERWRECERVGDGGEIAELWERQGEREGSVSLKIVLLPGNRRSYFMLGAFTLMIKL